MKRSSRSRRLATVLIILTLGAATLAVAPALSGYLVAKRIDVALQRASVFPGITWRVVQRERGWFRSRLETELTLAGHAPIHTRLTLVHGPVHLRMLERRRSPFLLAVLRATSSGVLGTPLFQAAVQLDGDWSARLHRQDIVLRQVTGQSAQQLNLRAVQADASYSADGNRLSLRMAADRVGVGRGDAELEMVDLAALGEYRLDAGGWPFGDTSLRVADARHPPTRNRVKGLELTVSSTEHEAAAAVDLTLHTVGSDVLGRDFGPMEVRAAARKVPVRALRTWLQEEDAWSVDALRKLIGDPGLRVSRFSVEDPDGTSIVQASATLQTTAAEGPASSRVQLELRAAQAFAEFVFWHGARRTLGRSSLFGKLNELSDIQQSDVARASAVKQLSVLTTRGYLTWNRGWYRTRITLEDGQWALNGRPVYVR